MKKILKQFYNDTSGNFAMMFAVSILPLIVVAGSAVDYTRMSANKGTLQDRLDAAVLLVAHDMKKSTKDELQEKVKEYLQATLSSSEYAEIGEITLEVDTSTGTLKASAVAATKTSFLAITGITDINYDVATSTKVFDGKLEVALVLDNTYSMSADGKLAGLKVAATNFVNSLYDGSTKSENIGVSLVPFNSYVNVGIDNRTASWIDVEDDYVENQCSMSRTVTSKSGCTTEDYFSDGILSGTVETCTSYEYSDPIEVCTDKNYVWAGCVGSRQSPFNLTDKNYNKEVPGVLFQDSYSEWECPKALTPLTSEKQTLLDDIDAMTAKGQTYIPSGVMWGWRALSDQAPFDQGGDVSDPEISKVMILMTDGDNQASANLPDDPRHSSSNLDEANEWTKTACANAKKDGISIYTITFGDTLADETKQLMVDCADSADSYFDASNASDLNKAFEGILSKIYRLHLAS